MRVIYIPGCHFQTMTPFLGQNEAVNSIKNIIVALNKIEKNVKLYLLVECLHIRSFKALDKTTTGHVAHMEM